MTSMSSIVGETITITRETVSGEDSQGNPTYTTTDTNVTGCVFAPTGSTDDVATFGTRAITGGTVYAPAGTVFLPEDVLTIRGLAYTVDGEAGEWKSPFTTTTWGVEVAVKRAG